MNQEDLKREKAAFARLQGEEPKAFWVASGLVLIGLLAGFASGFVFGRQNVQLKMAEEGLYFSGATALEALEMEMLTNDNHDLKAGLAITKATLARIEALEAIPDHTATLESHAELLRLLGSAMINHGWIVQDGDQLRLVPVQAPPAGGMQIDNPSQKEPG